MWPALPRFLTLFQGKPVSQQSRQDSSGSFSVFFLSKMRFGFNVTVHLQAMGQTLPIPDLFPRKTRLGVILSSSLGSLRLQTFVQRGIVSKGAVRLCDSQFLTNCMSLHTKLMLGMPFFTRHRILVEGLETVKCGKRWKAMGPSPKTFNFIYERNAMKLPSMCAVQCGGMEAKTPRK